ncbi:right-handed parallel beta-helix repeat-containing protein [Agrilutibacter solisilvae]|uniref:Right-handed parallel beta-helix repeat-containing protein n=1 Tax=Agrilutibacter solisilvae TaxID=2763317 RepID=A0A974XXX3_9GAMM|nr:right-handed parallel beta-helix repeat-containing protein [Lysobacter solisilvae]QSX77796.1 right-handed parallel beta-helix repeat-containing protein [Lysobacter solisilvae]
MARFFLLLPIFVSAWLAPPAQAETHRACTGYITSLPTVISKQGTWCLLADLTTAQTGGGAIELVSNNITIDCNGHRLGNLAAGPNTVAFGVLGVNRRNIVVRNCSVRGFRVGIYLRGQFVDLALDGGGHVVEDNTVQGSTGWGIVVDGLDNLVRRNRVLDIGLGSELNIRGISTYGTVDILDNLVDTVSSAPGSGRPVWGITLSGGDGQLVARNQVRNLMPDSGFGWAITLSTNARRAVIRDNLMVKSALDGSQFACFASGTVQLARDNVALGYPANVGTGCMDGGGNLILP